MYKVLVVDDEPFMLEAWKLFVEWETHGFVLCGTATDGEEALRAIADDQPDVVITDIEMPVMDGLELIRSIRENTDLKRLQLIIVSGYSRFDAAKLAISYQVDQYLLKPLIAEEIHGALDQLRRTMDEQQRSAALTGKEQADAVSAAFAMAMRDGSPETIQTLKKLLHANDETECQLLLAECRRNTVESALPMNSRSLNPCISVVQNVLQPAVHYCCFDVSPDIVGIWIWGGSAYNHFHSGVNAIANQLAGGFPELFVYISSKGEQWLELRSLYRQALEVRQRVMKSGKPAIFRYDRLEAAEECCWEDVTKQAERLLAAADQNDAAAIQAEADQLTSLILCSKAPAEWLTSCVSLVKGGLLRRYHQAGGDPQQSPDWLQGERAALGEAGSYRAEELAAACMRASEQIKGLKGKQSDGPVSQAVAYVKERYLEKLHLKDIAQRFELHSVYLGQQFKRVTGYSFNDYIHLLRVEEAKKLLRRTDMKVSAISKQLGYHDTDYFTAIFKAFTNKSPSAYKSDQKGERTDDEKAILS